MPPSSGGDPFEVEAPTLVWATGLGIRSRRVPGLEAPRRTPPRRACPRLFNAWSGRARRVRRGRRRPDRHRDRGDARLEPQGHAGRHARPPLARFLPRISDAAASTLVQLGVGFLGDCRIEAATTGRTAGAVAADIDTRRPAAATSSSRRPGFAPASGRSLSARAPAGSSRWPPTSTLRVVGHDDLWACGDCVSFPHPRWGRIAIPHWDHALRSGRHVADSIMGSSRALRRRAVLLQRHRAASDPAGRPGRRPSAEWRDEYALMIGGMTPAARLRPADRCPGPPERSPRPY